MFSLSFHSLEVFFLFLSTDYYKDRYEEPYWSFNQFDNIEEIISNKELRNGTIIVRPQIYVQYKDTIIFIININDFYLTNTATLTNNRERQKTKFTFEISDGLKDKLKSFEFEFLETLKSKIEAEGKNIAEDVFIFDSRIAEVKYQNIESNNLQTMYVYFSNNEIRTISSYEVQLRNSEEYITLDSYQIDSTLLSDAKIMEYIEKCSANF